MTIKVFFLSVRWLHYNLALNSTFFMIFFHNGFHLSSYVRICLPLCTPANVISASQWNLRKNFILFIRRLGISIQEKYIPFHCNDILKKIIKVFLYSLTNPSCFHELFSTCNGNYYINIWKIIDQFLCVLDFLWKKEYNLHLNDKYFLFPKEFECCLKRRPFLFSIQIFYLLFHCCHILKNHNFFF